MESLLGGIGEASMQAQVTFCVKSGYQKALGVGGGGWSGPGGQEEPSTLEHLAAAEHLLKGALCLKLI